MPHLLLAVALAAVSLPLKVRVLEKERPTRLQLEAEQMRCDGKPLASPAALRLENGRVATASGGCDVVSAKDGVRVSVGAISRRYPGAVAVSAEGSQLKLINEVDVDDYLPSVVTIEAGAMAKAALEAQAVVSRTFALASRHRHDAAGYEVCDLAHCQVYRGLEDVSAGAKAAVDATKNQVLLLGGVGLKPTYFHGACGGHTSRPADVFGEEGAGVPTSDVGKDGPLCKEAPGFDWVFEVERTALAKVFGADPELLPFEVLRRDTGGRVVELKAFGKRLRGTDFMSQMGRAFGWQSVRSMKVTVEVIEGTVRFTGRGEGHGVGLCQRGAAKLASTGATSAQILQKYFPDCRVRPAP